MRFVDLNDCKKFADSYIFQFQYLQLKSAAISTNFDDYREHRHSFNIGSVKNNYKKSIIVLSLLRPTAIFAKFFFDVVP